MSVTSQDFQSKLKLARLWHFTRKADFHKNQKIVSKILNDGGDFQVNCKITMRTLIPTCNEHLTDCTALHLLYHYTNDIETFKSLLERGADFTEKNAEGNTVIHGAISWQNIGHIGKRAATIINSVLSAHVKHQNVVNPRNNNGLSHLHAACIVNHVDCLKFFLDNGASVDQAINLDSDKYPGFTALHYAVCFSSFEAAQILLSRGANVNAKDARGLTPLDVAMEHRIKLLSVFSDTRDGQIRKINENKLRKNEKIVQLLLLNCQCVSAVGMASLHVASTLQDLSIAENLLKQSTIDHAAVPITSSICPGYTAAHFAALNSIDAVKLLLTHGAKLETRDAKGRTVVDICLEKYNIREVHDLLASAETTKRQTRLLDFLQATASLDQLKLFLQNEDSTIVAGDSLLWQGYAALHLAVIVSKRTEDVDRQSSYGESIVKECLKVGHCSINTQNSQGETAIHLAFKLGKRNIIKLLLEHLNNQEKVENVVDEDSLSYLHIACAEKNETLVGTLLLEGDSNIVYSGKSIADDEVVPIVTGSTPLHLAATTDAVAIVEMLLEHGADLHAADVHGMTPVHCLMKRNSFGPLDQRVADVLFRSLLNDNSFKNLVVDDLGLSYLHVASFFGNRQVVQKLLELGADINATITSDLQLLSLKLCPVFPNRYLAFTPLHMAQVNPVAEVIDLLIVHGADVFVKSANEYIQQLGIPIPLRHKNVARRFMSILWDREDMQKSFEDKLGLTRLHIACYLKNDQYVRSALKEVVDVNARIHEDSEIFAGCTPLHLLSTIVLGNARGIANFHGQGNWEQFAIGTMVQLLLDHGADVTAVNAKKNTPIHLLDKYRLSIVDANLCVNLLLNAHRDFSVNPANHDGMSHFHLACYFHKVEVVEKFLQHGFVDVNRPTDFFTEVNPGMTPLHFALSHWLPNDSWIKVTRIVDLLLKNGADLTAKDCLGDTPLHKPAALYSPGLNIVDMLVSHGADINSENVRGQKPFDNYSFSSGGNEYLSLLEKYNYPVNSWNHLTGEGNIGIMLSSCTRNITKNPEFNKFFQSSNMKALDGMGRTVIHNSVAAKDSFFDINQNVIFAIKQLMKLGIDLEHRDEFGQTALHYAARLENTSGANALLKCGADIDVVDDNGMSAFSHAVAEWKDSKKDCETSFLLPKSVPLTLHLHVQKLLYFGIEVSELNENLSNFTKQILHRINPRGFHAEKSRLSQKFFSQVDKAKTIKVGVGRLVLFDFLNETGGPALYPYLSRSERTVIDDFFENFNENEFNELGGIVKLQFRKMKVRLELIDSSLFALRRLLGFSFPGLCEQICRFLSISELKKLITAMIPESNEEE